MKFKLSLLILTLLCTSYTALAEKPVIRVGVLAFGTVNWELTALKNLKLLEKADFQLKVQPLSTPQAGKIALQSGAVDMIVADWIWVSRQRSQGTLLSFYPYSATSGGLIVPEKASIQSINDLQNKKLGIAGGELDKNWLLLQALAQKKQLDLNNSLEKVYGAPPLLNQQLKRQRIDAVMTYWHFAAKLESEGYRQLLNGQQILQQLGIEQTMPTLGYVFNETWAKQHKQALKQFLTATQTAKNQLCESDSAWQAIIPLTRTNNLATQKQLRQRYCEGRIQHWGENEQLAAEKIYTLLRQVSHNKLTGKSSTLQTGTFWHID